MNNSFKDRVIKRRKEINLSQLDLANALGYTPQAISKFEKSNSSFPITIVPKLANALDITIDSLLGERQSSFHPDRPYQEFDEKILISNLRNLRKKHDLTIGEAAKKLDVSPRSLAAYEKGETVMPISCFEHALSTYEVSAEEMLYLRQEEPIAETSEPLVSPKHHFWTKKIIALISSIVVILAVVIPVSIHYASRVKEDTTSSSSPESSSEVVATEADFPSDYSIEPVGFSVASPLGVGDYSFEIVLPDGYSLHEGITIQWGYSGGMVAKITQENENEMTGIFHITAIYWKSIEIGVQATLVSDSYNMVRDLPFTIHNDNGQINPNFYPGLNSLYLTCPSIENGIVKKGSSYEITVHFVSSDNATFVFDKEKYSMDISGAPQKLTMDYSKSDPFFIFDVPSVYTLTAPLRIVASITPVNTTNFANSSPLVVTIE